jgi:hypothetical protein
MTDTEKSLYCFDAWIKLASCVLVLLLATACHHDIRFEDINYSTGGRQYDAGLVTVIDPQTLAKVVSIKSWATGIANSWDARPGEMLRQVSDVEMPQMFKHYRASQVYEEPQTGTPRLTMELTTSHYAFSDFHTTVVIQARVYQPGKVLVFEKSYREEGDAQGGKMVGAGAFGMKSAVRQSSFDAYKKAFGKIRADLTPLVDKQGP